MAGEDINDMSFLNELDSQIDPEPQNRQANESFDEDVWVDVPFNIDWVKPTTLKGCKKMNEFDDLISKTRKARWKREMHVAKHSETFKKFVKEHHEGIINVLKKEEKVYKTEIVKPVVEYLYKNCRFMKSPRPHMTKGLSYQEQDSSTSTEDLNVPGYMQNTKSHKKKKGGNEPQEKQSWLVWSGL